MEKGDVVNGFRIHISVEMPNGKVMHKDEVIPREEITRLKRGLRKQVWGHVMESMCREMIDALEGMVWTERGAG